MTLAAGIITITLEYARDLKNGGCWFVIKQNPYCILRVGGQTFRSHTAKGGGRNPVWNETFRVNIMDENNVSLDIKDEDLGRDDLIGNASFSFSRARHVGNDRQEVAVFRPKSRKQHGFVSVSLKWSPHRVLVGMSQQHPQWAAAHFGGTLQQQIWYVIAKAPRCQQQAAGVDTSSLVYGNGIYQQQAQPPHLAAGQIAQAVVYQPVFAPLAATNKINATTE
ncbi:hypothetical protein Vretimale_11938 [Volvox reticuliferus]|uniref:C2 domain-containing protein n=1 Tax=Volvox reticuliferus TaxID=1737510 RepID=A0A8J4CPE7_9CHLO|nr:hypothetical protein Vretifemale_11335 [Volvox reticuliferus]GIM07894.1 hypothetical protein Vretimale_11938 [Volvox reticuliferus]